MGFLKRVRSTHNASIDITHIVWLMPAQICSNCFNRYVVAEAYGHYSQILTQPLSKCRPNCHQKSIEMRVMNTCVPKHSSRRSPVTDRPSAGAPRGVAGTIPSSPNECAHAVTKAILTSTLRCALELRSSSPQFLRLMCPTGSFLLRGNFLRF